MHDRCRFDHATARSAWASLRADGVDLLEPARGCSFEEPAPDAYRPTSFAPNLKDTVANTGK